MIVFYCVKSDFVICFALLTYKALCDTRYIKVLHKYILPFTVPRTINVNLSYEISCS